MENKNIDNLKKQILSAKETFLHLFVPLLKLAHNSDLVKQFESQKSVIVLQTEFGPIEIRNRLLTETHSRVLSEIIACGTMEQLPNGGVKVRFAEREILQNLEMGNRNYPHLRDLIKQIGDTRYFIGARRSVPLRIIDDQAIEILDGYQTIVLSPEYVELNSVEFAIANSTLNEKMRSLKVSTIPTIIKAIYASSMGDSEYSIHIDDVLRKIGFVVTRTSLRLLKASLDEYQETLEKDFFIKYHSKEKRFTTTAQIEGKLTFLRTNVDSEMFDKFIGTKMIIEDQTVTIKEIKKLGFRNFSIYTEEGSTYEFQCFVDDFIYFLEDTKERKTHKVDPALISDIRKQPTLFD